MWKSGSLGLELCLWAPFGNYSGKTEQDVLFSQWFPAVTGSPVICCHSACLTTSIFQLQWQLSGTLTPLSPSPSLTPFTFPITHTHTPPTPHTPTIASFKNTSPRILLTCQGTEHPARENACRGYLSFLSTGKIFICFFPSLYVFCYMYHFHNSSFQSIR